MDRGISTPAPASEEELAALIDARDTRAVVHIQHRIGRRLHAIVYRRTGDWALSSDLVQETFAVLLRNIAAGEIAEPRKVIAYACGIAQRLAEGRRRTDKRRATDSASDTLDDIADERSDPAGQAETQQLALIVRRVIEELRNDRDRAILIRFYLDEEDKQSICADLKLTDEQFNCVLHRARGRFKELLEKRGSSLAPQLVARLMLLLFVGASSTPERIEPVAAAPVGDNLAAADPSPEVRS